MGKSKINGQSSIEATKSSIKSKTKIDAEVSLDIKKVFDNKNNKCTCCGEIYEKQQGNFMPSNFEVYKGNNGFISTCKKCTDQLFEQLTNFYNGNEEKAIDHICMTYGIYFNESPLAASKKISAHRSRLSVYSSKVQINPWTGLTYLDTIKDRIAKEDAKIVTSAESAKEEGFKISGTTIEKWGTGFQEQDYRLLEEHYKMLKKYNPNCDNNQEIFIKDLCYTKMLQMKSMREGAKSDDFDRYTKLYRDTFKQAGLKTIQETDNSGEETLGVTLATISQYTPEEYYKDRSLYRDFDGLGDYFERFVKRPLKNLLTGSKDRDKDFCVKEDILNSEDYGDLDE